MYWDRSDLERYERWLATPSGAYAFARECRLIEKQTAAWPRRGRTLLEIGCGPGMFLEFFHRAGFDVTGCDASPVMVAAARHRLGPKVECGVANALHLPHDPDSFDYVALLTVLEYLDDPELALREAVRVARRGIIVGYVNRFSLYRLTARRLGLLAKARWYSPWGMRRMLRRALGQAPLRQASVLPFPVCAWRDGPPLWGLGKVVLPLPVGAYCVCAADLSEEPPLTPLLSFAGAQPTKSF